MNKINPEANEIELSDLKAAAKGAETPITFIINPDVYDDLPLTPFKDEGPPEIDLRHAMTLLLDFDPSDRDDAFYTVSEVAEIVSNLMALLIGLDDDQLAAIDPNKRLVF